MARSAERKSVSFLEPAGKLLVSGTRRANAMFRTAATYVIIALCALLVGCRDQGTTIWSKGVPSSDNEWVATAVTKQWSGPGNAYVETTIYLKRTSGSQRPVEILNFPEVGPSSRPGWPMTIKWITNSRLDIAVDSRSNLGFHKMAGIEISVEDVSNPKRKD